jgi:hypothetical protein
MSEKFADVLNVHLSNIVGLVVDTVVGLVGLVLKSKTLIHDLQYMQKWYLILKYTRNVCKKWVKDSLQNTSVTKTNYFLTKWTNFK